MKTIEQKAKAYDELIPKLKEWHDGLQDHSPAKDTLELILPQFRESEDERIRKFLLNYFKSRLSHPDLYINNTMWEGVKVSDIIAYLEKQKEQKSAELNKLDDWKFIVDAVLTEHEGIGQYLDNPETERIAKKLQERFSLPTSKPMKWTEEDEETFHLLIEILKVNFPNGKFKTTEAGTIDVKYISTDEIISRIKSLRPSWKPSEEQMKSLIRATNRCVSPKDAEPLMSLYNDLKKL